MTETTNVNLLHFVFDLEDEKVTQKEIAGLQKKNFRVEGRKSKLSSEGILNKLLLSHPGASGPTF